MQGAESELGGVPPARGVVYCLVPRDLAPRLHESLRRHFAGDPSVAVVVERRDDERRGEERRLEESQPLAGASERRRIRNREGRRVGARRAVPIAVDAPQLPRRARAHVDRLVFVERLEPSDQQAEDVDTARLVTRIQGGDSEAFAVLYMRYFDRVYAFLRLLLRNVHDAEDAAQQVFIRVLESLPRYEHRRSFWLWLMVVVRHYAIDELRRSGRLELLDPAELERDHERATNGEGADLAALGWISDRDLVLFVERLPLVQRQVLLLRYMLDLSTRDIAALLDRKPADVRLLHHRALGFLRERLSSVRDTGRRRPTYWRRRVVKAQVLRARRSALLG